MSEFNNLGPSSNLVPILQLGSFILFNMNVCGVFREKKQQLNWVPYSYKYLLVAVAGVCSSCNLLIYCCWKSYTHI